METTRITFQKYPVYKDSGVEWLGEIPEHWEAIKMKYLFRDISEKNKPEAELLSVTQDQGVVPRTWVENRMVMPSGNLESFKFIRKGDFAISLRSFEGGLEYCYHDGIISPAYTVLKKKNGLIDGYYKYLFKSKSFISEIQTSVVGIREGKNISFFELSYSLLPIPSPVEQTAIATFLDDKTAKIDRAITQKQQMINLLKERKQIMIQELVTGKKVWNPALNAWAPPNQVKDSGVAWIGMIPEGWSFISLKYILKERNERSVEGKEPIFMMSQVHGLVIRSDYHDKAEVAQSTVGNKIVHTNDLVFNKLKAHLGVFFKSTLPFKGIVSPDYAVYHTNGIVSDMKYLELLFRHPAYISQFICKATGIVEGLIRLYTSELYSIKVPVPAKKEQAEILAFIETQSAKIDKAISIQEQQIEKLKEYKATLIDGAVTGKIRVN
jgi:type I restriction enzyme, S subunit